MVTIIMKATGEYCHQIEFVNDWKCSHRMRREFEGSKWQRLDGSENTRSGHFHTGRPLASQRGAHHQVWSGQKPHQFWPGLLLNKAG